MKNLYRLLNFAILALSFSANPASAQQFHVSANGPITLRTNRSVTKIIEVTRTDSNPSAYVFAIYAGTDDQYPPCFTATPYPGNGMVDDFEIVRDSTIDIAITFNTYGNAPDTVKNKLYLSWADSIGHPFDTIPLIGIADSSGRTDWKSDCYDSVQLLDTSGFSVQRVGDSAVETIGLFNACDRPITIDTVMIWGNTHSCFELAGSVAGKMLSPLGSDSFPVRYHANGAAEETSAPFTVFYRDSSGIQQSVTGFFHSNLVPAIEFDLPKGQDSVPVLDLGMIDPYVFVYGTVPITSLAPERSGIYWSMGQGSGGNLWLYSDSSSLGEVPGDSSTRCPYVYMPSDNTSGNLSTYESFTDVGLQTGLNYYASPLNVESWVVPAPDLDSTKWVINLFHNQTVGVPVEVWSTAADSLIDSLVLPSYPLWLRNGTSDSLHIKLAQLWVGLDFSDTVLQSGTPLSLAPGKEVEVEFTLHPGGAVDTERTPDPNFSYYLYADEFLVETDSSYEPSLNTTQPSGGIPVNRTISPPAAVRKAAPEAGFASVYPDPAASDATIEYSLPTSGMVNVVIYDALGRPIGRTPTARYELAGPHLDHLETSNLATGSYACRVFSGSWQAVTHFIVARRLR